MEQNEETPFHNLDSDLNRLEELVKQLEDNTLTIDNAISIYTEGMQLAVDCRRSLNQLTQRVTEVRKTAMREIEQLDAAEAGKDQMPDPAAVMPQGSVMPQSMAMANAPMMQGQPQYQGQQQFMAPQPNQMSPNQMSQSQGQVQPQDPNFNGIPGQGSGFGSQQQ